MDCCSGPDNLSVHINMNQESVLCFLSEPSHLSKWTGHKAIRYIEHKGQWVETRLNMAGKLTDFVLIVKRSGNDITVSWPERQLSFTFATKETHRKHGNGSISPFQQKFDIRLKVKENY